jgi:hypothetical protein
MSKEIIPVERIARSIFYLRGQKVMLDFDLASLYGVAAKVLNQAVKRNRERFPDDFMFQLTAAETSSSRSQFVTLNKQLAGTEDIKANWSQFVTSSRKHRGKAYRPYAFTEQGVAMLSSVLNSERAVKVNIAIMRAFVKLRDWVTHASRVRVSVSRRNDLSLGVFPPLNPLQSSQWRDPIANTRDACATQRQ